MQLPEVREQIHQRVQEGRSVTEIHDELIAPLLVSPEVKAGLVLYASSEQRACQRYDARQAVVRGHAREARPVAGGD